MSTSTPTVAAEPIERGWPWPAGIRNPFRRLLTAEPWLAVVFFLSSFVVGVAWFVVLVTLLAIGLGLAITWIGLPILAVAMLIWIAAARSERWRIRVLLGDRIATPYRPLPEGSLLHRAWRLARDPAVWRDLFYVALLFPIGIAQFVIAVVAVMLPVAMITSPLYYGAVDGGLVVFDEGRRRGGWLIDTLPEAMLLAGMGVILAVPAGLILIGVARAHAAFAGWLIGPWRVGELEERVETLTRSRSAVMDAQLAERRRIERDLHDGAQQRLVALAMDLGLAKEKLDRDPAAARVLVESSHEEAKRVLVELRELVRGIHPAVLTDRGLDAAISAIAGRSPVPVTVDVELPERPPEAVESAAYFVVLEALANVAKHANATEAWVRVFRQGDRLLVIVMDDGAGGADPARGTGLAGLADRVAGLDGRLTVESPADGPTRVRAEFPLT